MSHDRAPIEAIKARLRDPHAVAATLGLTVAPGTRPHYRVVKVLCPWHSEDTASCGLEARGGVLLVRCHGCRKGGDVIDLVGATMGLDARRREDAPAVLRRAAELAGVDLGERRGAGAGRPARRPTPAEELTEARRRATAAEAELAYVKELLRAERDAHEAHKDAWAILWEAAHDTVAELQERLDPDRAHPLAAIARHDYPDIETAVSGRAGDPPFVWG